MLGFGRLVFAGAMTAVLGAGVARADEPGLDRAIAATLVVHSLDSTESFLGSAFLWGGGRIAVTCAHVVYGQANVEITFADGHDETARVVARDPVRDVAVLEVSGGEGRGLQPAPAPAVLAQTVYAVGAPLGVDFTVTRGMVSARPRQLNPAVPIRLVQHDASVNNGNSGGPLVDRQGRVLGMNSQIVDGSDHFIGLSFAISVADLERIVPALIAGTLRAVPVVGLRLRPVDGEVAAALNVARQGELVDYVEPGGIAALGGLKAGDIITEMDGKRLTQIGDVAFRLEAAAVSGNIVVDVLRDKVAMKRTLDLAATRSDGLVAKPPRVPSYAVADVGVTVSDTGQITGLQDKSAAMQGGLKPGDVLLAVNGQEMKTPKDIAAFRSMQIKVPLLLLARIPDGVTKHVIVDPWHPWFDPLIAMGVGAGPNLVSF